MTFLGLSAVDWTGVAAIATVVLALEGGALLAQWKSRWDAQAEQARTDEARVENELHRQRFTEVWEWQRSQPEGENRARSARWYGEWTGASSPCEGGTGSPPQTPGLHSATAEDAYLRYLEFLAAQFEPPGRLGRPRPPL